MSRSGALLATWLRLGGFQAVGFVLSAATVALAAIAVEPAEWGRYGLLLSMVQTAQGVCLGWINQAIVRLGREELAREGSIAGTLGAAAMLAVPAFAVALLGLIAAGRWLGLPGGVLLAVVVATLLLACFEAAAYAGQAMGRFTGYTSGQLLYRLGPLAVVAAALAGAGVGALAILGGAAAGWLAAAIATGAATRAGPLRLPRAARADIGRLWRYGRLLPIASAAAVLVAWMDVWFISALIGARAAGVYWWAYSVVALAGGLLLPLSAALAPRMIDVRLGDDRAELERHRRLMLALVLLAALSVMAALVPLHVLADLALPERYRQSGPLMVVLSAGLPAQLGAALATPLLVAFEDRVARVVGLNVATALLKLLLNALLVPGMGEMGAAVSTVVALWMWALALVGSIPAETPAGTRGHALALAAATGVTVAACALLAARGSASQALAVCALALVASVLLLRRQRLLAPLVALEPALAALPGWCRAAVGGVLRRLAG